jgi:hypothetical protein
LNFGNVYATASSRAKKLTLTNKGTTPAVIGQLTPSSSSFAIGSDGCSTATLAPKGKCTFYVVFAPVTVVGGVSETLVVPYNGSSPVETLAGTAIPVTVRAPSSRTLPRADAGAVGKAVNIRFTNRSTATVQLGAASTLTDFTITGDGCTNGTLVARASCVVTVAFTPAAGTSGGGVLTSVLSYDFAYGANSGAVAITLKSTVK